VMCAEYYNWAWASPEMNSIGLAVLNEFKRVNYPNIYQRQAKEEEIVETESAKLGLRITAMNRKAFIEALKTALKQFDLIIYDQQIIDECRTFVMINGKAQADVGYHDDCVMMMLGLVQLHLQCPLQANAIDWDVRDDSLKKPVAVMNEVDTEDDLDDEDEYDIYSEDKEELLHVC